MPITFLGKVTGYNHVGVTERFPDFDMYIYSVSKSGKKISIKPISFNKDLSLEQYNDLLTKLTNVLVPRPDYQKLASNEDFEVMSEAKVQKLIQDSLQAFDEKKFEKAKFKFHEIISYKPNALKVYFLLIQMYLGDNDIEQAKDLIDTLNLKSMKGEIVFSDEDYSTLTQLKYRRFEIEENMNS